MNKYILLLSFLIAIIQLKAQSKKEQIQILNLKIDSLFGVLQEQRSSNDKQFKYFENFISTLNNEKQKLKEQIKDLEAVVKFKDQKLSSIHFTLDSLIELSKKSVEFPKGTVFCNGQPTAIVDVTNPKTGKTWMDRNIGASQAATSSKDAAAYGDLYQWGRRADGHQCRNSAITSTLSSTDQPSNSNFILSPKLSRDSEDWRTPHNDNLWQGVNGINNPCPTGYRLPTYIELDAERSSWSQNNSTGAFGSPLKLPMAGWRDNNDGSLGWVGFNGIYWSSSVYDYLTLSWDLHFSIGDASMLENDRAYGHSVRCLKD